MVIDTSAVSPSVASFVEVSIVIESRYGSEGIRDLDVFISRAGIELMPVDASQGQIARSAFSRFGKGRHRAGLNYGDCFSYAPQSSSVNRCSPRGVISRKRMWSFMPFDAGH